MNLSICIYFTVLCSCLSANVLPNDENAVNVMESGSSQRNRNLTQFTDLDMDVVFYICERLCFMDLLNTVEAYPQLATVATSIMRQRHYEVEIRNAYPERIIYGRNFTDDTREQRFVIESFELSLLTLKHFGAVIQRLTVYNDYIKPDESASIFQQLNKYAGESLKNLNLGPVKADSFDQFVVPFNAVEDLEFSVTLRKFASQILPLNQVFPNIRRLAMYLRSDVNLSFIDCEFEHLEVLFLGATEEAWTQQNHFEGLMKKNPQIRNLELKFLPNDYIKIINKLLPNVEELAIADSLDLDEPIHFFNVKYFDLSAPSSRSIRNLSFSRLETLKTHYSAKHFDEWIEFFHNHPNISELHLYDHFGDRSMPLMELTAELNHLQEVTLENYKAISVGTICRFIEDNEALTKFQFVTPRPSEEDERVLRERFGTDWNIQEIGNHWTGLAFERKAN